MLAKVDLKETIEASKPSPEVLKQRDNLLAAMREAERITGGRFTPTLDLDRDFEVCWAVKASLSLHIEPNLPDTKTVRVRVNVNWPAFNSGLIEAATNIQHYQDITTRASRAYLVLKECCDRILCDSASLFHELKVYKQIEPFKQKPSGLY